MENKTYYDWLFNETDEEKSIMAQIEDEREAFDNSPESLAYKKRLDALWDNLKKAQDKRRNEAKKHRPRRKPVKERSDADWAEFKKMQVEKHENEVQALPENIKNLIFAYRNLTDSEKRKFSQMSWYYTPARNEELDNYSNPKTTDKDIRQLQEILVQTVIDFINERNLTDIDSISFSADGLGISAKHGEWTCSTDTSIRVEGLEEEDGSKFMVRRLIGDNLA